MPIISGSLLLMVKGAMFLAKSGAIKAAVIKYGAYLISSKGIAATAVIAAKTATAAGVVAIVCDTTHHSIDGFNKMRDGIIEGDFSKFIEGLSHLRRAYSSATDLLDDFDNYINDTVEDINIRNIIKDGCKEFKSYIIEEIEDNGILVIREIEQFLRNHNMSEKSYNDEINNIYAQYLLEKPIANYQHLLGRAGNVYNDIVHYNMRLGICKDNSSYDHFLAYCIAGWIKDNLSIVSNKTQQEIAKDITDNIIRYLEAQDNPIISDKFSTDINEYNKNIEFVYKYFFTDDINSYDAFLSSAGKAYNNILQYNYRINKWTNRGQFDHVCVYYIANWAKESNKYHFLENMTVIKIAEDITDQILKYIEQS